MKEIVTLTHSVAKHPYVSVFLFLGAVVAWSQRERRERVDVNGDY